jgi:hypothetical protein
MQPIKRLTEILDQHADSAHSLFALSDLRAALPDLSDAAFSVLLNRATAKKVLTRICRGIYVREKALRNDGLLLYHVAARLRANAFNYISLEAALSDAGVISQLPLQWVTIMSSGRSNIISCGRWGTIEFVHTSNTPRKVADRVSYDTRCGLWRADIDLALQDMRRARRPMDLINRELADELVRSSR